MLFISTRLWKLFISSSTRDSQTAKACRATFSFCTVFSLQKIGGIPISSVLTLRFCALVQSLVIQMWEDLAMSMFHNRASPQEDSSTALNIGHMEHKYTVFCFFLLLIPSHTVRGGAVYTDSLKSKDRCFFVLIVWILLFRIICNFYLSLPECSPLRNISWTMAKKLCHSAFFH